jgi:integrase
MQSFSVYKRKADRRKKDTKWLVAWTDENGVRKAKTAFTDYEASLELARKIAKRAAMATAGVTDPFEDHRQTPIAQHLDEFIASLKSANRAPRYVLQVEHRIRRILAGLGVKFLHELDPVAVDRFLADLAQKKNYSGITRNEYIASIKSFTRWAVTYRRAKDDPLVGLKALERKAIDPAHPRRALSMAEIGRLLEAAERRPLLEVQMIRLGPNKGKLLADVDRRTKARARRKGRERRLVYLLAAWTGLRRNEIRQLTWGDIHVDTIPARITLRARTTKSKRADALPIHPQLADELRAWRPASAGPTHFVISTVPHMNCLRADLALAGIAHKDEAGRYVDFHSLRVSLATMLAANRVSPRAAQALMRHTDPRLTAGVYTDEKLLPLAAELLNVPAISTAQSAAPCAAELAAELDLQSLVAGLTASQKQALVQMLSRSLAS